MKKTLFLLLFLSIFCAAVYAETVQKQNEFQGFNSRETPNQASNELSNEIAHEARYIKAYHPTYILPFYYTTSPVYPEDNDARELKHQELSFQLSFRYILIPQLFAPNHELNIAYTQKSFWQAYGDSPYFRETNYEPEVFVSNILNHPLRAGWVFDKLNTGFVHESNGRGGSFERSWNRLFADIYLKHGGWLAEVKPWYIFSSSTSRYNPDMHKFLGHGLFRLSYHISAHVLSLMTRNNLESSFRRGAAELTWSFPLISSVSLRAYVDFFAGYGQNLIQYDKSTQAFGIGVALSDE